MADASVAAWPSVGRATLPNPVDPRRSVSAVLFDLDGTLYDQPRLRRRMAAELALLPFAHPFRAWRTVRGLRAFRRAQEALRTEGWSGSATEAQLTRAAASAGLPAADLATIVDEWMGTRPLRHLRACRAPGLDQLLSFLGRAGLDLGILSDYPIGGKLEALGVSRSFALTLCPDEGDVNAFKPNARGFLVAATRWGLDPAEVLVVGDRLDADAAGARAAGMSCVIVGATSYEPAPQGVMLLSSLERLYRVLSCTT